MRLTFLTFCNKATGYGHWFRSLALAKVAHARGHHVTIASDKMPPSPLNWIQTRYNSPESLNAALKATRPDWLIVDLPDTLPGWIEAITPGDVRICVLNGIGYDQANNVALRVIQGVADLELPQGMNRDNTLMGAEYVIIRPEIARFKGLEKTPFTFVWGGGNDHLRLLQRFSLTCPDWLATLVVAEMTSAPVTLVPKHTVIRPENDLDVFRWLAGSSIAVVAMGMITWEALYLGVACYVFSYSDIHLMFAQAMDRHGLISAYPKVGLPESNEELRAFLEEPFWIIGDAPDDKGAERVIKEIERR